MKNQNIMQTMSQEEMNNEMSTKMRKEMSAKMSNEMSKKLSEEMSKEMRNPENKYQKEYSEKGLMKKLQKYARKAGIKIVYSTLLLYYVLLSKDVPLEKKGLIISALGYLILPIDLIPDGIPVLGFSDDAAVLLYAIHTVRSYITPEIEKQAKAKLGDWFESFTMEELRIE